jgi:DNA modification methylase
LRSYLPKGHALKPQELGSEKTLQEWVENQVRVLRLVREALADHGTVWWNCGDTYSSGHGERGDVNGTSPGHSGQWNDLPRGGVKDMQPGNLCLIPWRLAIAAQDDGWLVRSVIVWHKPAPMPASLAGWRWMRCRVKVKAQENNNPAPMVGRYNVPGAHASKSTPASAEWSDCPGCRKCKPNGGYVLRRGSWRPTSSWEPILMLAKSPKYFADGEAVKTVAKYPDDLRRPLGSVGAWEMDGREQGDNGGGKPYEHDASGANLRDVWTIAAEPLKEKHYASFPTELVTRCLKAGTSAKGYCPACGAPWVRMVESTPVGDWSSQGRDIDGQCGQLGKKTRSDGFGPDDYTPSKTIGWRPSCTCPPAEPRPGRVLDPFAGSGRTLIAAGRLGLDAVGVELNPDYAAMAERLIRADAPLFNT